MVYTVIMLHFFIVLYMYFKEQNFGIKSIYSFSVILFVFVPIFIIIIIVFMIQHYL
ncbi:hypothetical protein Ctha_2142 [Chloroherpeton thalassium ATCC 35110]|uniref:Uncharacterized protein n=1 Tax=Chloroherpeton thalassium (strain ATCC 35110 / GB-78) TaxID=517418 RepID=B3QVJ4_CHLT3|nr:hypothetical protein Ctha_2142 [Chloroherpeton thalassium ATCC 35110]